MTQSDSPPRLWIQASSKHTGGREAVAETFLASMVSSGVGALIKTAADRLVANSEYTLADTLAFEPAFRTREGDGAVELLIHAITINAGRNAVALRPDGTLVDQAEQAATASGSPVLVRVEFERSNDGTAVAAKVTHWVYSDCLDHRTVFRDDMRKVSIEIKITDVSGAILLATSMQVTAKKDLLGTATPASGNRLRWTRVPTATAPAGAPGGLFGPVNIEVHITESAGPSWLARLLGATLDNQKGAVEAWVKGTVTQALDAGAAAQTRLGAAQAAQKAWDEYATAHSTAKAARGVFDKDPSAINRQALLLALAVAAERLSIARESHGRAGLPFNALPGIAAP